MNKSDEVKEPNSSVKDELYELKELFYDFSTYSDWYKSLGFEFCAQKPEGHESIEGASNEERPHFEPNSVPSYEKIGSGKYEDRSKDELAHLEPSEPSERTPSLLDGRKRSLALLAEQAASCARCDLAASRNMSVFSRGNPFASLCFVGEAPGADEDRSGTPFVGKAGQLLDKMITAMGLSPDKDVYVCNVIKCRPEGNRRPKPHEVQACAFYIQNQLELVSPKVIVVMGNTAAWALLNTNIGMTKLRGKWRLWQGRIPVMPTYHPSYLLRLSDPQSHAKRETWQDLKAVMQELHLAPNKL